MTATKMSRAKMQRRKEIFLFFVTENQGIRHSADNRKQNGCVLSRHSGMPLAGIHSGAFLDSGRAWCHSGMDRLSRCIHKAVEALGVRNGFAPDKGKGLDFKAH